MWTLISSIDVKRTRRRMGRVAVTTIIVVATATEVALSWFAQPARAAAALGEGYATPASVGTSAPAATGLPTLASAAPVGFSL